MYDCKFCSKSFKTHGALNGHQRVHNEFAGKYTGVKAKAVNQEAHICVHCSTTFMEYASHNRRFCNLQCSHDWQWENRTKPRVELGKVDTRSTLIRYLTDRDGYACSCCGIKDWQGQPLSLDVDHIDGDPRNNLPSNLRLICPNCHRQTETWGNSSAKRASKNGRGLSGIDPRKRAA